MNHQSLRKTINQRRKKKGFLTLMKTKNGSRIIKKRRNKKRKLL